LSNRADLRKIGPRANIWRGAQSEDEAAASETDSIQSGAEVILSRAHLPKLLALLVAAAAIFATYFFFPVVQQCEASFSARRTILRQLTAEDALTLTARHTLDDDWDDDNKHFPLSHYCPRYFDYKQNGEMKNISIHEDEIFYGSGPVQ
jgi:hypothetical protein